MVEDLFEIKFYFETIKEISNKYSNLNKHDEENKSSLNSIYDSLNKFLSNNSTELNFVFKSRCNELKKKISYETQKLKLFLSTGNILVTYSFENLLIVIQELLKNKNKRDSFFTIKKC
jgi:hypothetical protein